MQLSLFDDNRTTVLLHIADEFIRSRDLTRALSVYDEILLDTPGDEKVAALRETVGAWVDPLTEIGNGSASVELLKAVWTRFDTISLPSLCTVALDLLIEEMSALPCPERIFTPPRFHLGQMLLEARRFEEAADCFLSALAHPGIPLGAFLAWHGDALTLAGRENAALESYLSAFLEDPFTVDLCSIRSGTIRDLHLSLQVDAGEEIDENEEAAWLPVWGWLDGPFPLRRDTGDDGPDAAAFGLHLEEAGLPLPSIWYRMLAYAEGLRLGGSEPRELGAVRRLLKRTNGFMFACYLEKFNGRR